MRTTSMMKFVAIRRSSDRALFLLLALTAMTGLSAAETTPPQIAPTKGGTETARWGYVGALANPGAPDGLSLPVMAQSPKKVLVVTATWGYRHSSIPVAEKILAKLGQQSGAFTVDYVQQPDVKNAPKRASAPKSDANDAAKQKYQNELAKWEAHKEEYTAAEHAYESAMKKALEKLSVENLKNYDAVIFANTQGNLPLPDQQGFLDWIKSGKAFIGMHACSDTFHGWPAFFEMLGGEFCGHGPKAVGVECLNQDTKHAATAHLGNAWPIKREEIYFIAKHDAKKCHELLLLDKHPDNPQQPGRFPIAWCKEYGKGKVFYTSLGHCEDIWDDEWMIGDKKRVNPPEVAKAYQQHILGGIKWALGLATGDATPQAK